MTSFVHRAYARLHRVAVLGLLALFWLPASHAAPFSSPGATGAPGQIVSVLIQAENLVDLEAVTFDMTFDTSVLGFIGALGVDPQQPGQAFEFPPPEPPGFEPPYIYADSFESGIDGLVFVMALSPRMSGSGSFAQLSFNILPHARLGPTVVDFVCEQQLCGPDFVFDSFSATITVAQDTSVPVPAPGTTLLLLAGLGGLLAARRGLTGAKERIVH